MDLISWGNGNETKPLKTRGKPFNPLDPNQKPLKTRGKAIKAIKAIKSVSGSGGKLMALMAFHRVFNGFGFWAYGFNAFKPWGKKEPKAI